jgi:hypothetical protein
LVIEQMRGQDPSDERFEEEENPQSISWSKAASAVVGVGVADHPISRSDLDSQHDA